MKPSSLKRNPTGMTPFRVKECKNCGCRYACYFACATYRYFRTNTETFGRFFRNLPIRKRIPEILIGVETREMVKKVERQCKLLPKMGIYFKQKLLWPEQKTGGLGRKKI